MGFVQLNNWNVQDYCEHDWEVVTYLLCGFSPWLPCILVHALLQSVLWTAHWSSLSACCDLLQKFFFRESLIKHLFLIALFAYINHKMFYICAILWVVHMSSQILDLWNVESVWKHYQLTLYNFKKSSVIPSLSILSVSLGFSPMSIVNIRIFGVTVDILLLKQYL